MALIARTSATVATGGLLSRLDCTPPLTLRRVRTEDEATCGLCLVGTAAGPLAGDDLTLCLHVEADARAVLAATGASIAQGRGSGRPARMCMDVGVGARSTLRADPGPLVVCAGSRVEVSIRLAIDPTADVEWRDMVVLGRTGDPAGAVTLRWDVTRGGHPLLRQDVDLADPYLTGWNGMLRGRRVLASCLLAVPGLPARAIIHSDTAVASPLAESASLLTVLADDAADATRQLDRLIAGVRGS